MNRSIFSERLKSIVIPEGTAAEDLNKLMLPLCDVIVHMMPSSLFRYRTCNKLQIDAFREDNIYAVSADKFNDPYDTLIRYDIESIRSFVSSIITCDSMKQLRAFLEQGNDFPDSVRQSVSDEMINSIRSHILSIQDPSSIKDNLDECRNRVLSSIEILFPILAESSKRFSTIACFCESIQSVTMWSHYANYHQGFALEYNLRPTLSHGINNVGIFPVIYEDERIDATSYIVWEYLKMMGINAPNPDITSSLKIALHKSSQWEYEKEWRLIDTTPRDYRSEKPSVVHMKPIAIYYGQRMSLEDKRELHEIALEKGIKEYCMYIDNSSLEYKMQYKPFDNNVFNRFNSEQGKQSQIEIALEIALKAHMGQRDLDGKPVILHPLTVALKGNNENEIVAGLLHDVVEDTGYSFDDLLNAGISAKVVDALRLLTHEKGTDYLDYVRRIDDSDNPIAINVKCNDLEHNLERGRKGDHLKQVAKHTAAKEIIHRINGDEGAAWDLLMDLPGEGKYWQAKFAFQIEEKPIEEATAEAGITIDEYMRFFHPDRKID